MPLDYHRQVLGETQKAKKLMGTDLGFLIINREMWWTCYGQGIDLDSEKPCLPCDGRGLIENHHSLEMALAALNITSPTETSDVLWTSYSNSGILNGVNQYDGVRAFACCSPLDRSPYALIIDMRGRSTRHFLVKNLLTVVESIGADFFSRYAKRIDEVAWFYRNSKGGLDRLLVDLVSRHINFDSLESRWDCSDFSALNVPTVDNRIQLMCSQAAHLADQDRC